MSLPLIEGVTWNLSGVQRRQPSYTWKGERDGNRRAAKPSIKNMTFEVPWNEASGPVGYCFDQFDSCDGRMWELGYDGKLSGRRLLEPSKGESTAMTPCMANYLHSESYSSSTKSSKGLSISVGVEATGTPFSGALNLAYSKKVSESVEHFSQYVRLVAQRVAETGPEFCLSKAFEKFLKDSKAASLQDLFKEIIATYGTHVVVQIIYGGQLAREVSRESFSRRVEKEKGFDARLEVLKGGLSKSSATEKLKSNEIGSSISSGNIAITNLENLEVELLKGNAVREEYLIDVLQVHLLFQSSMKWWNWRICLAGVVTY